LSLTLARLRSDLLLTETTVFGCSRFDFCKPGKALIYNSIKKQLDTMNGGKPSNIRDALIAEVSIVNRHTLLTADRDLKSATKDHGGMIHLFTNKPRS